MVVLLTMGLPINREDLEAVSRAMGVQDDRRAASSPT